LSGDSERVAHQIATKLRRVLPPMFAGNGPKNENDLNAKLHGLLVGEYDSYRREFPATQFGLARVIPDHELQACNVLIEAKVVRRSSGLARVTDEIAADVTKYPATAYLVFVVYDPERVIKDDFEFAKSIEATRPSLVIPIR
jgi:hypothetical protein